MAVVKVTVDYHFQKEFYLGRLKSFDQKEINAAKYCDARLIIQDLIREELDDDRIFDKCVYVDVLPDKTESDFEVE